MKPIKLNIQPSFLDGYIYLGMLFLISHNGEICSISMEKLIAKLERDNPNHINFLRLAFLRNEWLNNKQSKLIFNNPNFFSSLKAIWKETSNLELNIRLEDEEITKHHEVPSMPIFDFKSYGMKLFLGHRDGLHEFHINSNENEFKSLKKPEKIFDNRSTFLSAKSGELMISSNSDGLFRGSFQGINQNVKVSDRVLSPKSIRTGWSSYDVLNYTDQSNFNYFENKIKKPEKSAQRINRYSQEDETSDKTRIEEFGVKSYSIEELLKADIMNNNPSKRSRANNPHFIQTINSDEIEFSFNTNGFCFFVLKDGRIITVHLSKNIINKSLKFGKIYSELSINLKEQSFGNIISSSILPGGCVLELFDVVMVIQNDKYSIIEDEPTLNVKTFPSSKRFRNLVLTFKDDSFSIHSTFPIDLNYLFEDSLETNNIDNFPF